MAAPSAAGAPRLVQLADFHRPDGGSFVPLLTGVTASARERGWQVDACFFETARGCGWLDDLEAEGARVHLAPEALRGSDRGLRDWVRGVVGDGAEPVVLHSHFSGFDVASALARIRNPRLKNIWHLHGPLYNSPVQLARTTVKFAGLARAGVDAMLCPAENIRRDALRRFAPRERVRFFPTAIDLAGFPVADEALRREAREFFGIGPDTLVILHFGWHWKLKGGELFVRTIRRLVDDGHDDLVALERGGDERYPELARELGVGDRVRVLEPVERSLLLHAVADVQLASSSREGMAYAVLESLCAGTPVVATEIPGHAFLGDHIEACRTAAHTPEALAGEIERTLARSPQEATAEVAQAREWIDANLTIGELAPRLIDVCEALVAGRRPELPFGG